MQSSVKTITFTLATIILFASMFGSIAPAEAGQQQKGMVGAWLVAGQPDGAPAFLNTVAIHRDGIVLNADPLFGTGHGAWQRVGKRKFDVKFVTITSPFNPVLPNTIITVEGTMKIAKSRDSANGDFTTTFTDLDGNAIMPPSSGTIALTRLELN